MDAARAFRVMREVSNKNEMLVARHCDHIKRPLNWSSLNGNFYVTRILA